MEERSRAHQAFDKYVANRIGIGVSMGGAVACSIEGLHEAAQVFGQEHIDRGDLAAPMGYALGATVLANVAYLAISNFRSIRAGTYPHEQ